MTVQQQQAARFDANAYVQAHAHLVEEHAERIRRWDGLDKRIRQDANLSAFLARQLVHERAKIVETVYEEMRALEFVPTEMNHPRGAKSYATRTRDHVGKAKVTTDLAGEDPRVDVEVDEELGKYVNVRASYAYTTQDMEYSAFAGVPLPAWKRRACADVIARGVNEIAEIGKSKAGLTGLLNNANPTVITLTNGEWDLYPTTTAAQILADLQEIEKAIIDNTRGRARKGYTLVLPSEYDGVLSNAIVADSGGKSIKQWFIDSARIITAIEPWYALDGHVAADVAAADVPMGFCYRRSPDVLWLPMPIVYEETAPQLLGHEWVTRGRARIGSVEIEQPTEFVYVENLD